jgi:hypothetical protein
MRTRNTGILKKKQVVPPQAEAAAERAEQTGGPDILSLLKFGSQAILQQAVEEEITQYLGRETYERSDRPGDL